MNIAIGLALVVPGTSHGAGSTNPQEKAAKKACAAGDFRKGVEILAELYVETDDVTHIFNQGRCYEQNHQWVSAIDRFREYLRKNSRITDTAKSETERHLADCEAFRDQEGGKLAPPAVTTPALVPVTPVVRTSTPEAEPEPTPLVRERVELRSEDRGSGLRVTGIVLGSLGVAALATGLVLNLKVASLRDEYNKTKSEDSKSSYSSYKTGSIIGYAAGGGLLATGIILYLIGHSSGDGERSSQTAIVPSLSPSHFSLALCRSF